VRAIGGEISTLAPVIGEMMRKVADSARAGRRFRCAIEFSGIETDHAPPLIAAGPLFRFRRWFSSIG
jgi:hypothetical protein